MRQAMDHTQWCAGSFRVIYADLPWRFETCSNKGKGRSAEQHYSCMPIDAIKALPVNKLAAKDSVLMMRVTDTHLEVGFDAIRSWGFAYQ
jgi:N6-adenosine-specific RNA methylase IME4